jgi:hypothetical protein
MKRQQKFITTLSLIVALSGLAPVVAAEPGGTADDARRQPQVAANAGRTSDGVRSQPDQRQSESRTSYKLSLEQMDKVSAGAAIQPFYSWLFNICPDCVVSLIVDQGVNIYE